MQKTLYKLLHAGIDGTNTHTAGKAYFITVYSLIGFVVLTVFGLQYIASGEKVHIGYLEVAFGIGCALNVLILQVVKHVTAACYLFIAIIFAFLMVMLASGGIEGTGLFWFFVFPIVVFFLTGAKEGTAWMAALFGFTLVIWLLPDSLVVLPYADITIRQLLACLSVVALGVFFYQLNRDRVEQREKAIDRAKSEFLTLASHQLRTPISAIGWLSEIVLSGDAGKLNREQQDHIQHIRDSNQRLTTIVDAMLIVSGLELKQLEVRPEVVDLVELSRKVLAEQTSLYPEKEHQITESYAEKLPELHLDMRLAKIILRNLFSNAIKYTPKGGAISVSIGRSKEKMHPRSKGSVLITVSDTGYGIAKSQQGAVFSKLFRAENIQTKDTDGTGLGLYMVKEVLAEVGGRIWFESAEDVGSTFYILLPLEGMKHKRNKKDGHET